MKTLNFWDFKSNFCISIRDAYMRRLLKQALSTEVAHYKIFKAIGVNQPLMDTIIKNPSKRIAINTLMKILNFLEKNNFTLSKNEIQKNIIWIGPGFGKGLTNPKLPFNLISANYANILAAIYGDGTITNINQTSETKYGLGTMLYTNEDKKLRMRVINSCLNVFGGDKTAYVTRVREHDTSVYFPVIIRDAVLISGGFQGQKSVGNPHIPNLVLKSKDKRVWIAWLQQTLNDEGSIRYRENCNHEIFITRVTDVTKYFQKLNAGTKTPFGRLNSNEKEAILNHPVNLLIDEVILFKKLGIDCKLRPQEIYVTKKGEVKAKWRLYITRINNIIKFSKIFSFTNLNKTTNLKKIIGDRKLNQKLMRKYGT